MRNKINLYSGAGAVHALFFLNNISTMDIFSFRAYFTYTNRQSNSHEKCLNSEEIKSFI